MASKTGTSRRLAQRIGAFVIVMATLAALVGVSTSPASAVDVSGGVVGGFEVDGNEVVNTAGQLDWKNLSPTAVLTTLTDENSPDDFGFKGSSKENEPESWQCQSHKDGITPGKDNLLRTYIFSDIHPSSATLGLAFVRADGSSSGPNGDTHVNFELDRGAISFDGTQTNGPCPYVGRQVGDLLLSFAFPGNGQATVTAYTWDGDNWIEFVIPNNVITVVAATDNASAITAVNDIGGAAIPVRAFGEAALDLVALDDLTADQILSCPGFGHVSVRSRSSGQSFDSALQDHMGSDIDLSTCGKVIVHKTDDAGSPLAGAQFGLYASQANATNHVNSVSTCTSVADGSCTFDDVNPASYYVSEISAPASYTVDSTVVGPIAVGFKQTVDVTSHTFVDPRDTGFVTVTKALVDQAGAPVTPSDLASLNGAAFQLYADSNANNAFDAGEDVHLWPNPPADGTDLAGCTITNDLGFCSFGPVATGAYRLTETAVPPQTNKGPDVAVVVTKGTVQTPVPVTYTNSLNPLQIHLDKSGPASANIGDAFDYTFAVTTSGPALHDISVVELAPDRCNNGPITGPTKSGGDADAFLEVGESWTYTCSHLTTPADGISLLNTARAGGVDAFDRTISDDDDHTVAILYPNLQVVKTAAKSPVDASASAGFSITTTNLGPGTAANVTLTDTLPSGTWTIAGADAASCSGTTGTMTCSFGMMVSGSSAVVTLSRTTAIADCGTLHNTVTVATTYNGTDLDTASANNTSSADVVVSCPDVEVHKTAEVSPISAGDTARFSIAVHNLGSGTATGATVSDPLPTGAGLTWVIDSQSAGMGCAISSGTLSCGPFDLGPDAAATVVISAITAAGSCGTLPNTVTLSVPGDTNPANNTSAASITVLCPNLGITKVADAASVAAGGTIGFTITVSNGIQPGGTAKAVSLHDPLPSGAGISWSVASTSGVAAGCTIAAGSLDCGPVDLSPGQSFSVHVTSATPADLPAACKAYDNTAIADASDAAPLTASATTEVRCPARPPAPTTAPPEVLAETIDAPPTVLPSTTTRALPRTGTDLSPLLRLAIMLVTMGALLVAMSGRARRFPSLPSFWRR